MRSISAPSCSSTAATTRASPCGVPRPSQGWQTQVEGAYTSEQCAVDWDRQRRDAAPRATCQWRGGSMGVGRAGAPSWWHAASTPVRRVPCGPAVPMPRTRGDGCGSRPRTRTRRSKRRDVVGQRGGPAALETAGRGRRDAVAGRALGLRRTRYGSLAKTHLQQVAIAASYPNLDPPGRVARFAALAAPAPYPASRCLKPPTADLPGDMTLSI